jgi:hypothetical protein
VGVSKMRKLFLLCNLLLAICFISCDLFTGSKVDLSKVISEEVDWANAPKLSVRIEFPASWGVSSPAQGDITSVMDIRKGYEFKVEFTPDLMYYTLKSWMVFRTEDLNRISVPASWVENPEIIKDLKIIQPLDENEVTFRDFNPADKVFYITINTADPVTLVPCCDTEPRITRTEPRHRPDGPPYSRDTDIVLYFNGALDEETVKFADSETGAGIWITAADLNNVNIVKDNKKEKWFGDPEYSAVGGFFKVTMKTGDNLPPAESLMTVTVRGILNSQGNSMAEAGYSFSYKTQRAVNVKLISYSAEYKEKENKIDISFNQTGADKVVIYYRLNGGADSPSDVIIWNVSKLDDSGVREGRQTKGISEYEIFIELYEEEIIGSRTSFKIWNIPGMITSDTNPLVEIRTAEQLAAMKTNDSDVKYVLANDIEVSTIWTPIGDSDNQFKGKFYGNGHKVTFTGGSSIGVKKHMGLFGYTNGALIRDFTFEYNSSAISVVVSSELYIGGVAGYIKDTTVRNIITSRGTFGIKAADGSNSVRLGGIAGFIEGSGKIENCRAALSTAYISSGHGGDIFIGAIAGETGAGAVTNTIPFDNGYNRFYNGKDKFDKLDRLLIDEVTITADVSADKLTYYGYITIGGVVGESGQNTMNDITFASGEISFSGSVYNYKNCGGLIGNFGKTNIVNSFFAGDIISKGTLDGIIRLGGLVGNIFIGEEEEEYYFINNCRTRTNIEIIGNANIDSGIYTGGVLGNSTILKGTMTITNCFFEDGNIQIINLITASVGGFCGNFNVWSNEAGIYLMNNCGTFSGNINVIEAKANFIPPLRSFLSEVGGFTSVFKGNISNCFSKIDINIRGFYSVNAGGFVASFSSGIIENCYATGTVSLVHEDEDYKTDIGGLVGYNEGIIQNCYALGNVLVEKKNELINGYNNGTYVGGLVGRTNNNSSIGSYSEITNCFSAGNVNAQAAEGVVSVGGIVGNNTGTINNTAALGASVTAKGLFTVSTIPNVFTEDPPFFKREPARLLGRICGDNGSTITNNYALNTMLIEIDDYNITDPDTRTAISNAAGVDGEDAVSAIFFTQAFWKTKLNFGSEWDFSRVAKEGHPQLKNVGGQQ